MKKKIFTFVIPLLAAYILLAATDVKKELVFKPVWVTDLTQTAISTSSPGDAAFPFRLDELFGYMDTAGNLTYAGRVLHNAAIGENWFFNYSNSPSNLIARDADGSIVFSIDAAGYPFIRDGRLFIISPEGNGISEWDEEGNKLWERWFGSVITSIDVSNTYVLVGMLKGLVELIDREGKTLVEYIPENSRVAAVYGCAVSDTGNQLAVLSGIEPQRLTVLERREDEYKIAVSTIMDTSFRRTAFLSFSGKYLFIEGEENIYFLEPPRRWVRSIQIYGKLDSFTYRPESNLFFIVSKANGRSRLQVGMLPEQFLYETFLPGSSIFSRVTDTALYLGSGYNIMRVNLVEH